MKSLHDAMLDPELFGRTFGGPTFANWRAVAKMLEGLPLDERELALYRLITDREEPPAAAFAEGYIIKPRRAGGTLFAAALGLHSALQDYRPRLGPGEVATVAMIASDRRQARQLMNYVKGLIADSPLIGAEVSNQTQEVVSFAHRVNLEVHTTSFRSTRGYSYAAVILDELAYFRDDLSANPDIELVRAVRPGLLNLGGRLLGLSSPHSRRGHLYAMHKEHFGRASHVLVIQAGGPVLNPTLSQEALDRQRAEDPFAARSEQDAQFREDVTAYQSDEAIDAAVVEGRAELAATPRLSYFAGADVSGGAGGDASALAIAHVAPGARDVHVVLDKLVVMEGKHSPHEFVSRAAAALQAFGIRRVVSDRYAAEWPVDAFRHFSITLEPAELDKSGVYSEISPLFAERRIELLDDRKLITELRLLERRPRTGGKPDLIDHPPGRLAHDDRINAAAMAIWSASKKPQRAQGKLQQFKYALGSPFAHENY